MDLFQRGRLAEDQKVVITLLMAGAADEPVATELVLIEAQALDLRAHGAVENEDALASGFLKRCEHFTAVAFCPIGTEKIVEHGRTPCVVQDQGDEIT